MLVYLNQIECNRPLAKAIANPDPGAVVAVLSNEIARKSRVLISLWAKPDMTWTYMVREIDGGKWMWLFTGVDQAERMQTAIMKDDPDGLYQITDVSVRDLVERIVDDEDLAGLALDPWCEKPRLSQFVSRDELIGAVLMADIFGASGGDEDDED